MGFIPLRALVHCSRLRHHPGHDLAEAQGDDGQVVAPQAQGGGPEEDAEEGGHEHRQEHRPPEVLQEAQGVAGGSLMGEEGEVRKAAV